MRNTFIDTIISECRTRDDIFILSGDAGLGVFDQFKEEYPEQFLNMGVAEQNTISFAAGLALTGFKVFIYNIIPFVLYRCYEQVRNDICYQELPIVLVGIGSGVTYAPMGMTHYSVEDIGICQTLPNLTVISPIDPIEAKLAATYSLAANEPVYIRLAKRGEPDIHSKSSFDLKKPRLLEDGTDCALIFHGSVGTEVLEARDILTNNGINAKVISVPVVQPLDGPSLFALIGNVGHVFTVEEHFLNCGLGSILAREHSRLGPNFRFHTLGIGPEFIHLVRDNAGMRDYFGISASRIAERVKKTVLDQKGSNERTY